MLTRSKAKALATEQPTAIVTPSAISKGVHTRWIYPEDSPVTPSPPSRILRNDITSSSPLFPETSPQASYWSSGSSLSTLSDSSLSSLGDSPFEVAPPHLHIPSTPPPFTPKKLQRSPLNQRWVQEGTSWRLTLVHDSFTPADAIMRESMIQRQTDEIHKQQFAELMAARHRARRALGIDSDILSEDMDTTDDEERREFIREDTEPAEEWDVGPSQGPQRLGPHGTELIDNDGFTSRETPAFPPEWIARSKVLRWRPTEEFIN